jgi:23S rRNA pseudouridine955/2504/2580 synthase
VIDHQSNSEVPAQARRVRIGDEQAGQRLDNFLLRELKGVPKSRIYRLLRKGEVRVNGGRSTPTYKLSAGDEVRLPPVRTAAEVDDGPPARRLLDQLEAAIIYEDDGLLVLNKPPGIAVHGGSGIRHGVIEGLRALRPSAPFLELVHRLDRDTSGCLLIAKRRSRLRELHELLREGGIEKRYLALLAGRLPRGPVPVEASLDKFQLQGGERIVRVADAGKQARTVFRAVERFGDATLAEARIDTGRTHQIRVHGAYLTHPVVGDDKYGDREVNKAFRPFGVRRLFLHAHGLTVHWANKAPLVLEAPLYDDLQEVLTRLRAREERHGRRT